jgi:hypothetical protein
MTTSQTVWVGDYLIKHGRIKRNYALNKRISRLAARIQDLEDAGWEIDSQRLRTPSGVDHVYTLIKKPQ